MKRIWTLLALACLGCAHPGAGAAMEPITPNPGTPADMKTTMGEHDGYTVEYDFRKEWHVTVRGLGPFRAGHAELRTPQHEAGLVQLQDEVVHGVQGLESYEGCGIGVTCGGLAIDVYIRDWHEVDEAIRRVGAPLKTLRLREKVCLIVDPFFRIYVLGKESH